tara:strand:+ start:13561 stop:14508 length:948 start_codon:yes stop_codon:yes gene_type:complete
VAPINELLKPCPRDEFYVVNKPREAYWRVLFDNAGPGDRSASIVGESGHLERANAWIHLIGAVVFAMYAVIRAFAIDQHSYTAQLSGVSCIAVSIMFAVSTVYHVFNSVPGCAAIVRNLDIIAIYISMAVGYMADSALLTNDFSNVPFQTLADPMLAAVSLVFFFSVRRYFVPKDETRDFQFEESCSLGLFRFFHSDLEHAGLRVAGITTLTFSWMLYVSAAFNNVNQGVGAIWLTGVIFATIMLISGVVFDNMLVPDNAYADGKHAWWRCTACNSKTLGCAMTSHAWWHVISFCSVVIMTAAREYGLVYLRWSP